MTDREAEIETLLSDEASLLLPSEVEAVAKGVYPRFPVPTPIEDRSRVLYSILVAQDAKTRKFLATQPTPIVPPFTLEQLMAIEWLQADQWHNDYETYCPVCNGKESGEDDRGNSEGHKLDCWLGNAIANWPAGAVNVEQVLDAAFEATLLQFNMTFAKEAYADPKNIPIAEENVRDIMQAVRQRLGIGGQK